MSCIEFRRTITMPDEMKGQRLDRALSQMMPDVSRSQIERWMGSGSITLNGNIEKRSRTVRGGEVVCIAADRLQEGRWEPDACVEFKVVHEDPDLLVVEKPADLLVHPGAGHPGGTLVNGLIYRYPELAGLPRGGIVHRLDRNTSGLMAVGRTKAGCEGLTVAISAHAVDRHYVAVVEGVLDGTTTVRQPIGRHPRHRLKQAIRRDGRPAVTHFRVLEEFRNHATIEARLETGRMHQIRVHLSWLRHPAVGDRTYGAIGRLPRNPGEELIATVRAFGRQALHAAHLGLVHPITEARLAFRSPLPDDIESLISALRRDRDLVDGSPKPAK